MSLTLRQVRFYLDTCDIWARPGDGVAIPVDDNKQVLNMVYADIGSPDQTGVKCMLQTALEGNRYERPLGRTAFDNIFTLDQLFFEVSVVINDQDVVKITTVGSPLEGQFLIVQGEGRARMSRGKRKGNYKVVQLKRTSAPPTN